MPLADLGETYLASFRVATSSSAATRSREQFELLTSLAAGELLGDALIALAEKNQLEHGRADGLGPRNRPAGSRIGHARGSFKGWELLFSRQGVSPRFGAVSISGVALRVRHAGPDVNPRWRLMGRSNCDSSRCAVQ